jgi:hypothetical protein
MGDFKYQLHFLAEQNNLPATESLIEGRTVAEPLAAACLLNSILFGSFETASFWLGYCQRRFHRFPPQCELSLHSILEIGLKKNPHLADLIL